MQVLASVLTSKGIAVDERTVWAHNEGVDTRAAVGPSPPNLALTIGNCVLARVTRHGIRRTTQTVSLNSFAKEWLILAHHTSHARCARFCACGPREGSCVFVSTSVWLSKWQVEHQASARLIGGTLKGTTLMLQLP